MRCNRVVKRERAYVSISAARPVVMCAYVGAGIYCETYVSNDTRLALSPKMTGSGSLMGASMKRFGWTEMLRECKIVERMARWRVRRARVEID